MPTSLRRFWLVCVATSLLGCGETRVLLLPEEATVAVGARHDLFVMACRNELDVGDLLRVAVTAGIISAFGRIDVLLAVPEAIAPRCRSLPFTVSEIRWDGETPFEIAQSAESPHVFTLHALREGEATLQLTLDIEGNAHVVEAHYVARPVSRVDASVSCLVDATPIPGAAPIDELLIPSETTLPVTLRVFDGETELVGYGYGYIPLQAEGGVLEAVNEDPSAISLTTPPAPSTLRLTSPADPAFERSYEVFDENAMDALAVSTSSELPASVGWGAALRTIATVGGRRPCIDASERTLTTETPEVCSFGGELTRRATGAQEVFVDAIAPGACRVRVGLSARPSMSATFSFDVAPGWSVIDSEPALDGVSGRGLFASGPNDVLVVGELRAEGTAAVVHFNGESWTRVDAGTAPRLNDAFGDGSTAFLVGDAGTILLLQNGTLTPMLSGVTANLRAVWGSSGADVYAVGDGPTLLRFDGEAWSQIALPTTLGLEQSALVDVWGSSANDVYLVAERAVLRFDGSSFTDVTPPDDPVDGNPFRSVFASGPNDVWVSRSRLWRYDGASWTQPTGAVPAFSVHGLSANQVVAAFAAVFSYDGSQWTDMRRPVAGNFERVFMASPTDVYAIGPDVPLCHLTLTPP